MTMSRLGETGDFWNAPLKQMNLTTINIYSKIQLALPSIEIRYRDDLVIFKSRKRYGKRK